MSKLIGLGEEKPKRSLGVIASAAILSLAAPSIAVADDVEGWTLGADLRFRSEHVDQDNLPEDAEANTLRQRYSLTSPWWSNVRVSGEVEVVSVIGDEEFNNTFNGRGDFPVVADVESNEINQIFVQAKPYPGILVTGGRFVEKLNNVRFFGDVGWRQNNQTFDGVTVEANSLVDDFKFYYAYIGNANRIFSEESTRTVGALQGDLEQNTHLGEVKYAIPFGGELRVFNYYSEVFADADGLSNNSVGAAYKGKFDLGHGVAFKPYVEYAYQTDVGDNPTDYAANYVHIAPSFSWKGLTVTPAYELLGSDDGLIGFQTPFATLHKFNGFADQFLVTPAEGLQDLYIDATYKFKGFDGPAAGFINGTLVKFQYHDFNTDEGGDDIASEVGVYVKVPLKPITKGLYVEYKYADFFDDDDTAIRTTDVTKHIFGIGYKRNFNLTGLLSELE